MLGAMIGDMVGAPYEFDRGDKTKDFAFFNPRVGFTDDSVMTAAVAEALLGFARQEESDDDEVRAAVARSLQAWGRRYPDAGYGARFIHWLWERDPRPYGSFGNGSAMRVSAAGWLFDTLEQTRRMARLTAEPSHNHPEGIKGAEATAAAIFLARTGADKEEIRAYITREFGYDLTRTCDEIRPGYHHVESCQQSVPEAVTSFLEGTDYEDTVRNAISLGGDTDTIACIAGSIAEAYFGIPEAIAREGLGRLPDDIRDLLGRFAECAGPEYLKKSGLGGC